MMLVTPNRRALGFGGFKVFPGDRSKCGAGWNSKQAHDVPERTGRGDAIAGVVMPFIAIIGSSSSSSGEMVSSDCLQISLTQQRCEWLYVRLASF